MGEVTNVVLFDKEPDGVASVRYSNALAASECVRVCCLPQSHQFKTENITYKSLEKNTAFTDTAIE